MVRKMIENDECQEEERDTAKVNAWQITHKKGLNEKKLYSYMQACDTQPLSNSSVNIPGVATLSSKYIRP